jgi:succinoglycan biosynthesis protein ExoM
MTAARLSVEDTKICVVIPTRGRTEGLRAAIESVFLQTIMDSGISVLVVDNNPRPVEQALVESLSVKFNHEIEYIHEPEVGVSNARNAAMKAAAGCRFMAFLDDDMRASADWLASLLLVSRAFKAGVVFGPTYAIMPNEDDPANKYIKLFFECVADRENDGYIKDSIGIGGSLLDLEYCQVPDPAFDPALNKQGGEDDIFFDHLKRAGTRLAYSVNAVTYEIVPACRTTPEYVWKRNFGYGQGPARIQASRGLKGFAGVVYFMIAGAIQLALFGTAYALHKLTRNPSSMRYFALTARAVGKIFWPSAFSPNLYGGTVLSEETRH